MSNRSKTKDFTPDAPAFCITPYGVENIVKITFPKKARAYDPALLLKEIDEAAREYVTFKHWQRRPVDSQVRNELAEIDERAGALLESLRSYDITKALTSAANIDAEANGGFPEFPKSSLTVQGETFADWRGDEALAAAITGLERLQRWTNLQHKIKSNCVGSNKHKHNLALDATVDDSFAGFVGDPTHIRDKAKNDFFAGLAGIYERVFNEKPGVSRGSESKEAGGPFVRFVAECLRICGDDDSNEAILQRHRRMVKSASEKKPS